MKTAAEMTDLKNRSNAAVKTMESSVSTLNELIARLERDVSRSREYTLGAIVEAREGTLPILSDALDRIRGFWHEAAAQQRFWESAELLLSKLAFDPDPMRDTAIKQGLRAEYADMPPPLLQLSFEDARAEADLPRLWLIFTAGRRRIASDALLAEIISVNLDGLEIPEQKEALAAIAVCRSNLSHGEMIFSGAAGLRLDPVRKMQIGREQQQTARLVSAVDGINPAA